MSSSYRIVVSLDIPAASPEQAYRKLYSAMPYLKHEGIDWESTDEWYAPDGTALTESEISEAREKVFGGPTAALISGYKPSARPAMASLYRIGTLRMAPVHVYRLFGEPIDDDFGDEKVTKEWFFNVDDECCSVYDYKMTSRYDEDLLPPHMFWSSYAFEEFSIGGTAPRGLQVLAKVLEGCGLPYEIKDY